MLEVNIHEAKTQLSRLLARVAEGEEVIISRAGKPIARLVPVDQPASTRPLGIDSRSDWYIADDFDAPLPDAALADFER